MSVLTIKWWKEVALPKAFYCKTLESIKLKISNAELSIVFYLLNSGHALSLSLCLTALRQFFFNWFSFLSSQLTEEIILTDQVTTITCYSPEARRRGRKSKPDRPQYSYSKRPSRSSTENSLELQQYCEHSVNSIHTSRELINLANVRAPLEGNDIPQLPILNVNTHAISGLTAQAREMTGGQPDYVWCWREIDR